MLTFNVARTIKQSIVRMTRVEIFNDLKEAIDDGRLIRREENYSYFTFLKMLCFRGECDDWDPFFT
jgi:hypothetical protein